MYVCMYVYLWLCAVRSDSPQMCGGPLFQRDRERERESERERGRRGKVTELRSASPSRSTGGGRMIT